MTALTTRALLTSSIQGAGDAQDERAHGSFPAPRCTHEKNLRPMKRKEKRVSEMVDREGRPEAYFLLHRWTRGIRLSAGARSVAASAYVAGAPPRRRPCLCRALCSAVAHGCMILRTLHSPRRVSATEKPSFRGGPGRRVAPHPHQERPALGPYNCGAARDAWRILFARTTM